MFDLLRTHRSALLLITLFSITLLGFGQAEPPLWWGEDGVYIRQGHHIEWSRASYRAEDGRILIAWSDTRTGDRDIYGQLLAPDGTQLWESTGLPLVTGPNYRQEDPDIIAVDGGWIVGWADFRADSLGDVRAQKFNDAGEAQWPDDNYTGVLIDEFTSMVQEYSVRVVHDGAGGAILAWEDNRNDAADIYAQHVTSAGVVDWAQPLAVTAVTGSQSGITSDTDGNGNMLCAWNDARDPGNDDIYAAKITPTGQLPWGVNGARVCNIAGRQNQVKLCPDGHGGCYLAWRDERGGADVNLYMQRLDGNGESYWANGGVVLCNAPADQEQVRVAQSSNGSTQDGCVAVWLDKRENGLIDEVYCQKIAPDSSLMWGALGLKVCGDAGPSGTGNQRVSARLTSDLQGGAVIAWEDTRDVSDNVLKADLYAARVNAGGSLIWGDGEGGVEVCIEEGPQFSPVLRVDDGDGVFVIWSDKRTGSQSLRYQNLNLTDGTETLQHCGVEVVAGLDGDAVNPRTIDMTIYRGRVGIVWEDNRHGIAGRALYYQVIDTSGAIEREMNGDLLVPDNEGRPRYEQEWPEVCSDGNNGFFASFVDNRAGDRRIRLTRVDRNGEIACSEAAELLYDCGYDQKNAYCAPDGEGGCYVGWDGYNTAFQSDIYVMRMDENCQPAPGWTEPVQLVNTGDDDEMNGLAATGDGCCVAVWRSGSFEHFDVMAARVCGDGAVAWTQVVVDADNEQKNADIAADGNGGVYIAWIDNRHLELDKDIYAQRISSDGQALWADNGIVVISKPESQEKPVLETDSDNNLYVVWADFRSGIDNDIYGQKITPEGNLLWPDSGKAICIQPGGQGMHDPFADWEGGLYVFWSDNRGLFTDVYAMHYGSDGEPTDDYWEEENGGIINNFYQHQNYPAAASDGNGGAIVAWEDARASGKEPLVNIWAQRVNDLTVSVEEAKDAPLPLNYTLSQNFPNPFNPTTRLSFSIPRGDHVKITIYNALGRRVATLVDEFMTAGTYNVTFDAGRLASGAYFYKLETPSFSDVKRMTLLR